MLRCVCSAGFVENETGFIRAFLPFIEGKTSKAELILLMATCFASLYQQEQNLQFP